MSAMEAADDSGGVYDPTLLRTLERIGYDRTFGEVEQCGARNTIADVPSFGSWRRVGLDRGVRSVSLPADLALDFGGIAKGWAADLAAHSIGSLPWALIDAGGDLRIAGQPEEPVPIGVADPADPSIEILQLGVEAGALATSSVVGRRWGVGLHHLIDPRTSLPACTGVVQATVWAPTWRAVRTSDICDTWRHEEVS